MTINTSKVLDILDVQSQTIRETVIEHDAKGAELAEAMVPYPRDARGRLTIDPEKALLEAPAGNMHTTNFPDALRMGIQTDLFSSYNEMVVTYPQFVRQVGSNKQQEEYLKDSPFGLLPVVDEGQPYPSATTSFDSGIIIRNFKRGYLVEVTEEMQMFDQVGKVRETAELLGRAARLTEEQDVMNVLTTTANYTRNSTTGDNDGGANTQTLTFSPEGLITAFNILRTMKDRKTGVYLNVMPDTLVVSPKLEWGVRQLLSSTQVGGVGDTTAVIVHGQGLNNPFFSVVRRVIVSPQFGSNYEWALLESNRAIVFQRVMPLQVLQEGANAATTTYMDRDVIRFRVRNFYGVGMRDDRFAFFSNSSTKPTVN
jgi:hypothetical protein